MREQGYVALLAVLIVGAVSTAVGVALLVAGVDGQRGSLSTQRGLQARALASACAEEALEVINSNTFYTGTNNLSLGQGSCTYTVTNTGTTTRTVTVSGTVSGVVRRAEVYVTIGASSISITSWKEVS